MLVLGYLAVIGSALVAFLFVADATLEKNSSPVIVTSQRTGLPESHYHNALKTLATAPAPTRDMISECVLAAQLKSASDNALPKIEPAAREASAEAPRKHLRVEASAKRVRAEAPSKNHRVTQYTNYQQNQFDRFSIKGY